MRFVITYSFLLRKERCGKEFICLTGTRGPCQPNQVLAPVKEDQGADLSCTHLIGFPWKDCRAAKQVNQGLMTNQPTVGHCVSMETPDEAGNINLCPGYPDSYKFDPVTQSCQPFSNSGYNRFPRIIEDALYFIHHSSTDVGKSWSTDAERIRNGPESVKTPVGVYVRTDAIWLTSATTGAITLTPKYV